MRQDRLALGSPAHLSNLRRHAVLRFLAESSRHQARALLRPSGGRLRRAGRTLVGTWKLNLAKSKYSPGPAPSSETVTYESAGQGLKYSVTQAFAGGKPIHLEGTLIYDGKDYAATGTDDYDTVATKRVDAFLGETARK